MMRLDDIFQRVPIERATLEQAIYLAALTNSGAVRVDPNIAGLVGANDGRKFQFRYYKDLDTPDDSDPGSGGAGPVYTDDSDTPIPTGKIGDTFQDAVKAVPAMSWAEKDVVNTVGFLPDPLSAVASRVAFYWSRYFDQVAVAQLTGVIADNIANDSGDMVNNIGNPTIDPDPTNTISPEAIVDALQTAGDQYETFTGMVVHSTVMASLRKQNLIDSIPASDGRTIFQFYQGMRVVTSDNVHVDTTGAKPQYHSYFFAPGVLGFGNSSNGIVPSELDRDPRTGKGGGETALITRQNFSMHPYGFNWLDASVTGSVADTSGDPLWPNLTDYRNAANWDRVASTRKHVRLAALISNA